MKVDYISKNGRMTVSVDAEGHKGVWEQISAFQEVFEEDFCRKCESTDLKFVVRRSKDAKGKMFNYYELRCNKCGAKLPFGVLDDGSGGLFPKRKDDEGKVRGNYGWVKWNHETEREE
jgi:hypothetical protein